MKVDCDYSGIEMGIPRGGEPTPNILKSIEAISKISVRAKSYNQYMPEAVKVSHDSS